MPTIDFPCTCGKRLRAAEALAGKKVRCPACGEVVVLARPPAAQPSESNNRPASPPPSANTARKPPGDPSLQKKLEQLQRESQSAASRPCMLRVNVLRYYYCFPKKALLYGLPALAFFVLGIAVHWSIAIGCTLPLAALLSDIAFNRGRFVAGCVNPGVIVSLDPDLVAVQTDLSRNEGHDHPVIKIVPQPLRRMLGDRARIGERVATVASYAGNLKEDQTHWSTFHPTVINCATFDEEDIARVFSSLEQENWDDLKDGLAQVPKPYVVEQYIVRPRGAMPGCPKPIPLAVARRTIEAFLPHNPPGGVHLANAGLAPQVWNGIPTEARERAAGDGLVAIVAGGGDNDRWLFTESHMIAVLGPHEFRAFAWHDLLAAAQHPCIMELVLVDGQRLRLPDGTFAHDSVWLVERLLHRMIAIGCPEESAAKLVGAKREAEPAPDPMPLEPDVPPKFYLPQRLGRPAGDDWSFFNNLLRRVGRIISTPEFIIGLLAFMEACILYSTWNAPADAAWWAWVWRGIAVLALLAALTWLGKIVTKAVGVWYILVIHLRPSTCLAFYRRNWPWVRRAVCVVAIAVAMLAGAEIAEFVLVQPRAAALNRVAAAAPQPVPPAVRPEVAPAAPAPALAAPPEKPPVVARSNQPAADPRRFTVRPAPVPSLPAAPRQRFVVRVQITEYRGTADPTEAARQALGGFGWVDPDKVTLEDDGRVLIIGVRVMAINMRAATEALRNAGFKTGGTSLVPVR